MQAIAEFPSDVSNDFATKEFMRWRPLKIKLGIQSGNNRYLYRKQSAAVAEAERIQIPLSVSVAEAKPTTLQAPQYLERNTYKFRSPDIASFHD